MIDINSLKNKTNNAEQSEASAMIPDNEKLTATEFVEKVVKPIIELQEDASKSVKKIVRGSNEYTPVDGVITFPSEAASVGITAQESTTSYVETSGKVLLHLKITSIEGGSDTGNTVSVQFQRFANGDYTTLKTETIPSRSTSSTQYDAFDITDILSDGENQIRVVATDATTGAVGRLVFSSIVKASLGLRCMMEWHRPITDLTAGIVPSYAISGTGVSKTLNVRIYDNEQNLYRDLTYVIGNNTYAVANPWTADNGVVDKTTDAVKVLTHGVHTIEAWVTCTSGGQTYSSKRIKNQVMVVADASSTQHYMMIQQVEGIADNTEGNPFIIAENYVQNDSMFKYAVYDPTNAVSGMKVVISIDNANGDTNCLKLETQAKNSTQYTVPATIQIEGASVGSTSFVYLSAYDASNNSILSTKSGSRLIIAVKNDYNFAPVSGADFYLNPSQRNNGESQPNRILNAAKNNVAITSQFVGMNFDGNDGWVQASDNQRVLRVLAGQKVTIEYDPFAEYQTNYSANTTIEMDVKVSNVTNESDPIVAILNAVAASGKYTGVRMCPLEGAVMTASQTTYGQQNFGWREDTRTHIAINVCSAIYPDASKATTIPLVRVFVNGNPYREFSFALEKNEWGSAAYKIEIGQSGADIDIYSMRVYKKAVSSQGIMQNYKSSLPTSAAKIAFDDANDILASDGTISYEKAREKYSCIVHHGRPTSIEHPDATTCWLHIDHFVNGVYDKATSGDICKATKSCPVKGQGSTAKKYCDWNQQYDPKKAVLPSSDTTTQYISKTGDDGSVTRIPAIMVNGQLKQDGWVDGNGVYKGTYYQLSTSDNKAEKLVGKINYASCMQSHKMGSINAYNDLYRAVMGDSLDTIMKADAKARCTCKEDVFFFFVQETESSTPRFEGIMTFGSGKMDKKTWGYDSSTYPDFGMFEGSDNDQPVTNFERPWNDDVTYNADEEYFEYNGKGNIDFDAGATTKVDGKDVPTGAAVTAMKAFINFGYLHCTDIKPWSKNGGTATSLIDAGTTGTDIHSQYWVVTADSIAARGDLYSWSPKDEAWVKAGINGETRNVFTENPSVTFSADYAATNNALIDAIITKFKANGKNYFNERSCLFHSAFVQNLLAGSDNCAKNTYYTVDPTTHLINFHADDLDTIFKTDNVSWQTKPYYVDRVHHVDEDGNETYSGTHNMFFNTFDRAYESEKAAMMKDIFTAMASISGSVNKFMEDYFFAIQRGIPCIAYLEQARMRYERREVQVINGEITLETVNPITQQLGSQLESELQYMDRRLVYFMSYAAYGKFGVNGGGINFGFRGFPKRDGSGARIAFTLKPHQYIYPTGAFGQTTINPHVRLAPTDTYELLIERACSSDTTCTLFGIDYYTEIGNLGDISVNPTEAINIGGKRLTKVEAVPTSGSGEFRPSQITISANLVEVVNIRCADIGQNLDMSGLTRLISADLRDTSLNKAKLPKTQTLTSVKLGSLINDITISDVPNLSTYSLGSFNYVANVDVSTCPSLNTMNLITSLYTAKQVEGASAINEIILHGINWGSASAGTGITVAVLQWLCGIQNITMDGVANVLGDLDASTKLNVLGKFGNVDLTSNPLRLTYENRAVSSILIDGRRNIRRAGTYQYKLTINPSVANDFSMLRWSISSNDYATIDPITGLMTSTETPYETIAKPTATITATLTRNDGSTMEATFNINLYRYIPKVGDFAYADGEFSDELIIGKDIVGWAYRVDDMGDGHYKCLVESASNVVMKTSDGKTTFSGSMPWGIYPNNDSNSIPNAVLDSIMTACGFTSRGQVADIPTIANNGTNGLMRENGTYDYNYIRDYNAYDDSTDDGFHAIKSGSAHDDWSGKDKTDLIVAHADKILLNYASTMKDSSDKSIYSIIGKSEIRPSSLTELADLMMALQSCGGNAVYRQLAFPAAYSCKLYEPTSTELHAQYKKGNWYLPAEGDKTRLYIYFRNSRALTPKDSGTPSYSYADENNASRAKEPTLARRPWYANFLMRARLKGVDSPIVLPNQSGSWSSTERSGSGAWGVLFYDGGTLYSGGYGSNVVRPVVAFDFEL